MTLTFVGAGLFDERSMSIRGYEVSREADVVYMENYTSKLFGADLSDFEELIDQGISVLGREEVERDNKLLDEAKSNEVVFLVPGDPMISTTHVDLRIKAIEEGINTVIVHGASIFTAAPGLSGLQNYKFGRSATVTFKKREKLPKSSYDTINENKSNGLHTLLFLDIEAKKEKYMEPSRALKLLRKIEAEKKEEIVTEDTEICVVSRAGSNDPGVVYDSVEELLDYDFGDPLHTIIFPGDLHFREKEALEVLSEK